MIMHSASTNHLGLAPRGFDAARLDGLFAESLPRLAHMRDCASFARDLAASFGLDHVELLARAALLHDIGYAPALRRFDYHPLDGARFLEESGEHPWVVEGVLRHSRAERKAGSIPGVREHYDRRPPLHEAAWLVRGVTIADWRANGVGGRASFGQRMYDIASRNPDKPEKIRRARIMVDEVRDDFFQWAQMMAGAQRPLPWIFCDVDNTLIRPGRTLSPETRRAVRAWTSAGGRFSLATGKHPRSIAPLAEELGVGGTHITANGACLLENGRAVVLKDLGAAAGELSSRLLSLGLPIALYRENSIEAGATWTSALNDLFDVYGEIRPESGSQQGPVLKILCIVDNGDAEREAYLRDLAAAAGVDVCRSDRHFLEFIPAGGDKGQAMRAVTERAGWPLLHTLALGDSENDKTLFAQCGACAVVDDAQEDIRLGADWIIPSCTADGVGRLLNAVRAVGGWAGMSSAFRVS